MKDANEANDPPNDSPETPEETDANTNAASSETDSPGEDSVASGDSKRPASPVPSSERSKLSDDDTSTASPDDSGDETESTSEADGSEGAESEGDGGKPEDTGDRRSFWLWVAGIAVILAVELFIYGHNGKIEVCVGVEGVTEWTLKGTPRTPDNYRKAPMCVERMNLGMYSSGQDAAEAALDEACRRATRLNQKALPDCIRREKKWTRQVTKEQVLPWDERLYKRLLWME